MSANDRLRCSTAMCAALFVTISVSGALSEEARYSDFPVTVKGYNGDEKSSVSYSGQIARHVLLDTLKKLATKGNGTPDPDLKAKMLSYFSGKDAGRTIVAPVTKGTFVIKQSNVDDISTKKNLADKTFKGTVTGMPNGMTGPELVAFWIDKASEAKGGVDVANGYNYPQLISKFLMGAVSYNQAVDNYLDEALSGDSKPNDTPYRDGAAYTGTEHVWDEAFGYFGAPRHALSIAPKQAYAIAKLKGEVFSLADRNKDGVIDLKSEYVFGPAYYAAAADRSGKSNYLHTLTKSFIEGRQLIASANGEKLSSEQRGVLNEHARTIAKNWQRVLAEATYKYAGSVYKDMDKIKAILDANGDPKKINVTYIKHWGELKGFSLALQTGKENLGETATRVNRLIGFGPLLINASQVVDVDRKGNYLREQTIGWGEYMIHMAKLQKLLAEKFTLTAMENAIEGDIADLVQSLGAGSGAEND